MRSLFVFAVTLVVSSSALAQLGPIPGEERFAALAGEEQNSAGAMLGFAKLDEDYFMQLTLRTALNFGKVGIGFQIPLNLRVLDQDPKNDNDYAGLIREEDWDEVSEYFKVIRYVRYGHKHSDDLLFVRVGELAASIGHGTIMDRYMNNIDLNTFRVGSQFDVYTDYGGIETVIGDFGSLASDTPESRIVGGRLYVKPMGFVDPEGALNIFKVGFSAVTDLNAPRTIGTEPEPDPDTAGSFVFRVPGDPDRTLCTPADPTDPVGDPTCVSSMTAVDEDGNLVVANDDAAVVWGVDLEVEAVNTSILKVTPYTDFNKINGAGWGWHAGTLVTLRMPIGFDLTIPLRLEYRRFSSDYVPAYYGTTYEVERYTYPVGGESLGPKYDVVRNIPDGDGLNGIYGDMAFDFAGIFQFGAIYEGYKGSRPTLAAFMAVPALEVIQFKAYYTKVDVEDVNDLFTFDNRSLLIAQARYEIFYPIYVVGRFSRRWLLDNETPGSKTYGTFQAKDDWQLGVEAAFNF